MFHHSNSEPQFPEPQFIPSLEQEAGRRSFREVIGGAAVSVRERWETLSPELQGAIREVGQAALVGSGLAREHHDGTLGVDLSGAFRAASAPKVAAQKALVGAGMGLAESGRQFAERYASARPIGRAVLGAYRRRGY